MKHLTSLAKFGANLKYFRSEAGITQETLAERLDVTAQHLSYVESGHRAPSFELIEAAAQALHVSMADLFQFDKTDKPRPQVRPINRIVDLLADQPGSEIHRAFKLLKLAKF